MPGQPDSCSGCPLFGVGKGFVLGSGDPSSAKIGLLLEAPGGQEIVWRVEDKEELERRKLAYPNIDERYLSLGMPVVGRAGATLFQWVLAPLQLTRKDLFIDNTLRCLPPKSKQGPYPTGNVRKKAEAYCQQYSRLCDKVVFFLECPKCGGRMLLYDTNMPLLSEALSGSSSKWRTKRINSEQEKVLLDRVFSSSLIEELSEAPHLQMCWMRKEVQGTSKIQDRISSEASEILHKSLCNSLPNGSTVLQKRDNQRNEVSAVAGSGRSDLRARWVFVRKNRIQEPSVGSTTPSSDGKEIEKTIKVLGASSSQEWEQEGQSNSEFDGGSNEESLRKNPLSLLLEIFFESIMGCECGNEVVRVSGFFVSGFKPTVSLVQIHPSAISREPTPLPLAIKTFEKAKHFSMQGEHPLVMCGGKAVGAWMGHGTTVQTWLGHYESETELSASNRAQRREEGMKMSTTKEKKPKKLTSKTALQLLLTMAQAHQCGEDGDSVEYRLDGTLSEAQYSEIMRLAVPKEKKQ